MIFRQTMIPVSNTSTAQPKDLGVERIKNGVASLAQMLSIMRCKISRIQRGGVSRDGCMIRLRINGTAGSPLITAYIGPVSWERGIYLLIRWLLGPALGIAPVCSTLALVANAIERELPASTGFLESNPIGSWNRTESTVAAGSLEALLMLLCERSHEVR